MCYLKNLPSQQTQNFDEILQKLKQMEEEHQEVTQTSINILIPYPHKSSKPIWTDEQQILIKLFQRIEKNNVLIQGMQKAIQLPSENVENNSMEKEQADKNIFFQCGSSIKSQDALSSTSGNNLNLCTRLFGFQKYKYFLQLDQKFPKVIYKERNFNLFIKLMNYNHTLTRNCNILSLCCAISTSDAQWIHENRIGQPFMKGKTEVQLYKGEASFIKLYVRDVSRVYPAGKVNLVVYSKPSVLLYSRSNSYQTMINSDEVKPLIIEDLVIKAKKKQ